MLYDGDGDGAGDGWASMVLLLLRERARRPRRPLFGEISPRYALYREGPSNAGATAEPLLLHDGDGDGDDD